MKFWTGFVLGATVSGLIVASTDADQRRRLSRGLKQAATSGRSGEIATTVSDGVGEIADVATGRVTNAVDHATSKVAATLDEAGSSPSSVR